MSRAGTPNIPALLLADDRISFPHSETHTRCQSEPELFDHDPGDGATSNERTTKLQRAKQACSGCPIVRRCLKWALTHPEHTPSGVWAATTARDRTLLRNRLTNRLGANWADTVAAKDRAERKHVEKRIGPPRPDAQLGNRSASMLQTGSASRHDDTRSAGQHAGELGGGVPRHAGRKGGKHIASPIGAAS